MAKTVLVTGVNGFVGKHLVRELKNRGDKVIGVGREAGAAPQIKKSLTKYWACDLMDKEAVAKLPLEHVSCVISLAGLARVGDSFADPNRYKVINVGVLSNLCQVLADKKLHPRIIAVSTAAVYEPNQLLPLTEKSKLTKGGSPYAMSKLLMEQAAEGFRARGLEIIIVRPFNHIGPGQEKGFLIPDLFFKLKAAKQTGRPIKVGDLSTKRDYTDVRDVVKAYAGLAHAESLKYGVYNICSGKTVAGQEILDQLMALTGISVKVEPDLALMRPNDNPELYGNFQRLYTETGWQPQIPLKKTVKDFLMHSTRPPQADSLSINLFEPEPQSRRPELESKG